MWLRVRKRYGMTEHDPTTLIVPCRVDVMQYDEHDEPVVVGRLLADELRLAAISEIGEDAWDVADSDSSGLEAAYSSVLNADGEFREDIIGGDSLVYLYRFALHPDFYAWKRAVLHSFCTSFDSNALILAQRKTTPFTAEEFADLGFRLLPPTEYPAPSLPNIDRKSRFMLRENGGEPGSYGLSDYIQGEPPPATAAHGEWVKSQGPWKGLI